MGFMKPSTPSTPAPYQARERQRQGMISTILARRNSSVGQGEVNPRTLLRKTLG